MPETTTRRSSYAEYKEAFLGLGERLRIPAGATIQVLSVTQREGAGLDNWQNHWRYVLVYNA